MDYYSTLGVSKTASQDEIKKAYRKLAMQHHPDKGGNESKFKEVSVAYDTLGDPNKRAQYDAEQNGFGRQEFRFDTGNMGGDPFSSIFTQFFNQGFPGGNRAHRHPQRNRDLNIRLDISLQQSYTGTELEANYVLPSGKSQNVIISIPAGIHPGKTIRYSGMGDDSIPGIPRGHLLATIAIKPDPIYSRRNDDLVIKHRLNILEAMTGCQKTVKLPDEKSLRFSIRPGVNEGTEFVSKGMGFRNLDNGREGNVIISIGVDIPSVIDDSLKKRLEEIYAEISLTSK